MDVARLFLMTRSKRTRSNGLELEQRKFCNNVQKKCFTVSLVEHRNGLPIGAVESPSVETFKISLDAYL